MKGNHKTLNKKIKNLLINANTIRTQKNNSQLFSDSLKLLAINRAFKALASNLDSKDSESDKIELNKINIEGIPRSLLNSVLFNNAKRITQSWEGFK